MTIEEKIDAMGLYLPESIRGVGMKLSFVPVKIVGNMAYVSGHSAQNPDGSLAEPLGKLGDTVSIEEGVELAKLTALSLMASLKRELGDLERIQSWVKLLGMVNCTPDFGQQPTVINGASDLILELFGEERGAHARSAVGMASLPMNLAVEIEAIVEIK